MGNEISRMWPSATIKGADPLHVCVREHTWVQVWVKEYQEMSASESAEWVEGASEWECMRGLIYYMIYWKVIPLKGVSYSTVSIIFWVKKAYGKYIYFITVL